MGKETPNKAVLAVYGHQKPTHTTQVKGKRVLTFVGIEPAQIGDGSKLHANAPVDLNNYEKQLNADFAKKLKQLESGGVIEIIPIASGDWHEIVRTFNYKAEHISHAIWIDASDENKSQIPPALKAVIQSRQIHMLCLHIRSGMSVTKLDPPMLEFYLKNRQMFTYGETTIMSIMN